MVVSSDLILFAIKAIAKLGAAARKAYEDSVVGQPILLPDLNITPIEAAKKAARTLKDAIARGEVTFSAEKLSQIEADMNLVYGSGNESKRFMAGNRILNLAEKNIPGVVIEPEEGRGVWLLRQWGSESGPPSAEARLGLAIVEVGLSYVSANPAVIGIGGNADRLIAGVAQNIENLLPQQDELRDFELNFAEESLRILVQASLISLEQHVDKLVDEKSVQDLSKAILNPLIEGIAEGDAGTQKWYDIRDELLGPISAAAMGVLVEHQSELLGTSFAPDQALGAVTKSIILAVKEDGIEDDLGKEGLLKVYRAALDVAVKQPELFVGEINGKPVGQKILSDVAAALQKTNSPLNGVLATELIAVALESAGKNLPELVSYNGDWGTLATEAARTSIHEISIGLAAGVRTGHKDILGRLFNQQQANRFFKILVDEVTKNPGMIVGADSAPELRALTEVVARAMSEQVEKASAVGQNRLLLSSEDWLSVVEAAAKEVAKNPGRLIKIGEKDPERQLAYQIMSKLINTAAGNFRTVGRENGAVLFGETLMQVINDSFEAAAGNATRALTNVEEMEKLAVRLNELNRDNSGRIGRREWRYLYRKFIAETLDTGFVPDFTDDELLVLLKNA